MKRMVATMMLFLTLFIFTSCNTHEDVQILTMKKEFIMIKIGVKRRVHIQKMLSLQKKQQLRLPLQYITE